MNNRKGFLQTYGCGERVASRSVSGTSDFRAARVPHTLCFAKRSMWGERENQPSAGRPRWGRPSDAANGLRASPCCPRETHECAR